MKSKREKTFWGFWGKIQNRHFLCRSPSLDECFCERKNEGSPFVLVLWRRLRGKQLEPVSLYFSTFFCFSSYFFMFFLCFFVICLLPMMTAISNVIIFIIFVFSLFFSSYVVSQQWWQQSPMSSSLSLLFFLCFYPHM